MAVPHINPLPTPPVRSDAPADFSAKADAFVAALPGFGADANELAAFVDQRAIDADASAQAAAASEAAVEADRAEVAANTATVAASTATVIARADEVAANTAEVSANTQQVSEDAQAVADALASIADGPVASVNGKSGVVTLVARDVLPPVEGKSGMALVVNAAGNNVEWADAGQKIGDVLVSARGSVEGYLEAVGGIYLQSAYPELYAELGLLGGERGLSWDSSSITTAAINAVDVFVTQAGTIIQIFGTSNTQVIRSTDGGATWSAPIMVHGSQAPVGIDQSDDGAIAILMYRPDSGIGLSLRHSNDNGATWSASGPTTSSSSKPTFFKYTNGRWIAGGFANSVSYVTDVNAPGFSTSASVPNGSNMLAIASNDAGTIMVVGNQYAAVSTDNGNTWAIVGTAVGLTSTRLALSIATDKKGKWVVTGNGFVSRSLDDRATWEVYEGSFTPGAGKTLTDGDGTWLNFAGSANLRRSVDDGRTWNTLAPVPGTNYTANLAAYRDGNFYLGYRTTPGESRMAVSRPSYGYDTATQFRLPNIPVPAGLKSFIKAKEVA